MNDIQIISLLSLAGLNIIACLALGGICLTEVKRTRRPFKAKNRMISIEGINSNQNDSKS